MTAPLLVTGGTGTIGSRVVPMLLEQGQSIRVLSRHPDVDSPGIAHVAGNTVTGAGLGDALAGIDVVLHLAGGAKGDDTAARTLGSAAATAGVGHIVLISVVGADRMPIGYFRAKAAAELAIAASGVPFTIVRVAQLHDFVLPMARMMARLPLTPRPGGLRFEPVDRDEVAQRLTELTLGAPAGRVPDLAGPQVLGLDELVGEYREAAGRRRRSPLPLRLPGAVGRAYRAGDNLADDTAARGERTWRAFARELQLDSV